MARIRKKAEEPNELRWLTTYGDVVTLLLAFFVMLYAISQVDQQKFELFVSGLADPFGNPAVAEGLLTTGAGFVGTDQGEGDFVSDLANVFGTSSVDEGLLDSGSGIVGAGQGEAENEYEEVEGIAVLDGMPSPEDLEEDGSDEPLDETPIEDLLTTTEELLEVRRAIERALAEAGLAGIVEFEPDSRGLVVAIATDHVLFASGSAEFGSDGVRIIEALAPTLSEFSNQILVEGHTDTVPLNRDGYDNWNLSADRALAVLKVLASYPGIAPERLVATGYGEYHPREINETDEGKSANRRVELVIVVERGIQNG